MELEQEKFETVKELANLHTELSQGKAALETLKVTTDEYVKEREEKASEKVKEVLEASRDALAEVDANHDLLTSYVASARSAKDAANELVAEASGYFQTLTKYTGKVSAEVETALGDVRARKADLERQRLLLKGEKEALDSERLRQKDEKRKLRDERETLERAMERLRDNRI